MSRRRFPVFLTRLGVCLALAAVAMPSVRAFAADEDLAVSAPLVTDVGVEGSSRVETSAIMIHVSQKAGEPLDVERIDSDIKDIFAMGFFENVWVTRADVAGGIEVVYHVIERPYVREVRFEGIEEIEIEDVNAVIGVRERTVFDPRRAWEGTEAVRQLYAVEGLPDARLTYELEVDEANEAVVVYTADEGELIRIEEIVFEGIVAFKPRQLRKAMATREENILTSWITGAGVLNREELATDVERLTAFYYDHGHIHVRIDEPEVTRVDDELFVKFRIEEGPRFEVGEIRFEGEVLIDEDVLVRASGLEQGETFKPSELRESVFGLVESYGNEGYAFAEFIPNTRVHEDAQTVDVIYRATSGPVVNVRRIDVRGNTKTRDKVVRRELRLEEGQMFSGTGLRQSKARVRRLGFFDEVEIASNRSEDEDAVDIVVNVKEGRTGAFSAGAGFSSADALLFNARIQERNLFGRGQSLVFNVDFGSRRQNFRLGFTEPWFAGIPLSLGAELFKWEVDVGRFNRGGTGASIRASYPLWRLGWKDLWGFSLDNIRTGIQYKIQETVIDGVGVGAPASVVHEQGTLLQSSIRPTIFRNTIDHPFDPTEGSRQALAVELSGLGGETEFIKADLTLRWYWPIWKLGDGSKLVYSTGANIGYGVGAHGLSGEEMPLAERYFPGGIGSVRGYDARSLGPREEVVNENDGLRDGFDEIGGSQQILLQNEIIYPLFPDAGLKGVVFFDLGQAWLASEGIDFGELKYSWGAGIRWLSPLGPIRIVVGFPINGDDEDDSTAVQFSFGSPI